jgi:HPt (histidine-containing phosphotransfer) domain-containing protein
MQMSESKTSLKSRLTMWFLACGIVPMAEGGEASNMQHPTPNVQHPASVFDRAAFMARMMDDADLVREVSDEFLADIPRQIEGLKSSLATGDARQAERLAHSIKGAAANVAADALRDVAFEAEQVGKAGDLEAVTAILPRIEGEFERVREAMGES